MHGERTLNLLLICHANVCRSPIAESVFRERWQDRTAIAIQSAGLAAASGVPVHPAARKALAARGYSLSDDASAVRLTAPMMHWADLVLVMESSQRHALLRRYPFAVGKVWLLGHWLGRDVPDPFGGDDALFEATLDLIEASASSWQPAITV